MRRETYPKILAIASERICISSHLLGMHVGDAILELFDVLLQVLYLLGRRQFLADIVRQITYILLLINISQINGQQLYDS